MPRAAGSAKPTMKDVGALAGVSQSTVSHVVNQTGRIRGETERRVREAIRELGFQPNETARDLRLRRSRTIGLVVDGVLSSPAAARILQGAEEAAWERGYLLLLAGQKADTSSGSAAVDTLLGRQIDGLLYATACWRAVDPGPGLARIPSLLVNAWASGAQEIPAVIPDETEGGRLAAAAVVDAGHRRIAFLGGPKHDPASIERELGFRRALAGAGIPADERWVLSGEDQIRAGHVLARGVLDASEPPTALVCGNDRMALGALTASLECGRRVPSDLSVVGCGDQGDLAGQMVPGLTAVSVPYQEMGRAAVEHLLGGLDSGLPPEGATIRGSLVRRGSVAAPAGGRQRP